MDQKKLDDKRIKEIRDFQKSSATNRRCFDCNEMGPQYICLDFNTFICTSCSGIHREFSHRIKSISMSTFTDTEVKNIVKFGGNEAAQKYWLARFDVNSQPSSNINSKDRVRNFIRDVYVDRRWVFEEPKPKETPVKEPKKSPVVAKQIAPTDFNPFQLAPPPSAQTSHASFGDFSSFEKPAEEFANFATFDAHPPQTASFATFDNASQAGSFVTFEGYVTPPTQSKDLFTPSSNIFQPFGDGMSSNSFMSPQNRTTNANPFDATFSPPAPAKDPFKAASTPPAPKADPFDSFDNADPFAPASQATSFHAQHPTIANDPFGNHLISNSTASDPFAVVPTAAPTEATPSDPFNAFDSLTGHEPTPVSNPVDLWAQPPPSKPNQPNTHVSYQAGHATPYSSGSHSTIPVQPTPHGQSTYQANTPFDMFSQPNQPNVAAVSGVNYNNATPYSHNGHFPQMNTYNTPVNPPTSNPAVYSGYPTNYTNSAYPTNPVYTSNSGNPAYPTNPQYTSNSSTFVKKAEPASLVDPFASLDIGIKSSSSLTSSQSQQFNSVTSRQSNQYQNNNQAIHPNIVVAPIAQKPQSSNPFDMF